MMIKGTKLFREENCHFSVKCRNSYISTSLVSWSLEKAGITPTQLVPLSGRTSCVPLIMLTSTFLFHSSSNKKSQDLFLQPKNNKVSMAKRGSLLVRDAMHRNIRSCITALIGATPVPGPIITIGLSAGNLMEFLRMEYNTSSPHDSDFRYSEHVPVKSTEVLL